MNFAMIISSLILVAILIMLKVLELRTPAREYVRIQK